MDKGPLASAGPAGALTLTECLHLVGRAIYGGEWIAGLSPTDRARMTQYAGDTPPADAVIRAEIERIRDRDGLARVQRSQALRWIRGCGFRTDAGARIDRVAFEQALSRDFGRHRLPIPEAGGLKTVASGQITGARQSARGHDRPAKQQTRLQRLPVLETPAMPERLRAIGRFTRRPKRNSAVVRNLKSRVRLPKSEK